MDHWSRASPGQGHPLRPASSPPSDTPSPTRSKRRGDAGQRRYFRRKSRTAKRMHGTGGNGFPVASHTVQSPEEVEVTSKSLPIQYSRHSVSRRAVDALGEIIS